MLKKWMIVSFAAILLLAGCSGDQEVSKEHKGKQVGEVGKEVIKEFPYKYPLTGVGTLEEPTDRAIAAMINNHPKARPQSGLHKADIVYELLAEGEITRFLAVFQSEKADVVGPVRSARDYYIELAHGLDALFIAHGYSPDAKKMLDNNYVDHINGMYYDGSLFKRSSDRVAPHNSYISFDNINKGAELLKLSMTGAPRALKFLSSKEINEFSGEEVGSVTVAFSKNALFKSTYEFDDELGKYKRFVQNEQTVDKETSKPVLLDNVFIIETNHRVIDSAGRREIDITSGGNAYLLQKGQIKKIQWRNVDGRIVPYENGAEAGFVPGKTWICVIPTSPGLEGTVTFGEVH